MDKELYSSPMINKKITIIVLAVIIIVSCLSMGICPIWNGEIPAHRNQYEIMADSLLEGHLYMDYDDVDPKLEEMENPYDPEARAESNVKIHKDHAYYNGRYYMYFGIVPVILVFIPFKLITGASLTTYHATQLFVTLYICGVFLLFNLLKRRFFDKISFSVTLVMAAACSILSTWYIDSAPSLYCTAISSGICFEVWSIFFFIKAVWMENKENRQIIYAFAGSLCGALAFGCRPPVALANLLVIPFLIEYLRKKHIEHQINPRLIMKLCLAAMPYIVIGVLLMIYNYVRFDSVFEFGQSYQLTVADQHLYGSFLSNFNPKVTLRFFYQCFLSGSEKFLGILLEFPVLTGCFLVFQKDVRRFLMNSHLYVSMLFCGISILVITFFESLTAPFFLERYTMDILWLCGIMAFGSIGAFLCSLKEEKVLIAQRVVTVLAILAMIVSLILFLIPNDSNFTEYYATQIADVMNKILKF